MPNSLQMAIQSQNWRFKPHFLQACLSEKVAPRLVSWETVELNLFALPFAHIYCPKNYRHNEKAKAQLVASRSCKCDDGSQGLFWQVLKFINFSDRLQHLLWIELRNPVDVKEVRGWKALIFSIEENILLEAFLPGALHPFSHLGMRLYDSLLNKLSVHSLLFIFINKKAPINVVSAQ